MSATNTSTVRYRLVLSMKRKYYDRCRLWCRKYLHI